ncbi:MAG: polysaccharide deacetylase family protein [Thermoplasmata archaeon]|nr:polysaccharide deacetylase family protein [Thermoplasmata archaeon]
MVNALSIDLEYWWCSEFLKKYLPEDKNELDDLIFDSLYPLLELLDKHNTKATFFVLGMVAEKYPQLIEEIYKKGHEIASHAYSHTTLYELGREGFEEEIKKSINILGKYKPIGFRAPSFSINNSTKWAFEVLEKYGFKYDSSIFPIRTMLYGVPNAPVHIYRPSKNDVTKHDPDGQIIEFPLTIFRCLGKNIPIAGGFYLRVFPLWFLRWGIKRINRNRPVVIYIHPWETYPKIPRLKVPLFSRFVTYYGINSALKKFETLLKEFEFKPIREVLKEFQLGANQVIAEIKVAK